ncbi:MAG: hypothetical protein KAG97_10705 [Victivallales bacterium]|nr:hypothetical protein [Victivallales bacterium]
MLYCEPGGVYEREAIDYMRESGFKKPILVYVAGSIAEKKGVALGHAGAVVDGKTTSASAKMRLFDDYFGIPVFERGGLKENVALLREKGRGVRVSTLHELVPAASALMSALDIKNDFPPKRPLVLNPWLVDYKALAKKLPSRFVLHKGVVPSPFNTLIEKQLKSGLGRSVPRQSMRNASHASSNDGATPRIYGLSLLDLMRNHSFPYAVLLYWLGHELAHAFEVDLFEKLLVASLTNGPGTISAQGAKLSASAGNDPHTAMITTLGAIGSVHGGNGRKAAEMLIDVFGKTKLTDPYKAMDKSEMNALVNKFIAKFKRSKALAKEAGMEYRKIPCLGHPVFNTEEVNHDPRERVISEYIAKKRIHNVFLDFYHELSIGLMRQGATNKAHAVNVDAAIACVCMGIAWPLLLEKKITIERALDLPMITFALGRVAGGAGEFLDHCESGTDMDMRVPVSECVCLGIVKPEAKSKS